MSKRDAKRPLIELGFTDLEADVYIYLLRNPVSTGYKVAQGLGKLPPNVYQAIDALVAKGAVITESGTSRTCRAVPAQEMLASLRARFAETEAEAVDALSAVEPDEGDDRVYKLRDWSQVRERVRSMITGAQKVVLVDAFPSPLDAFGGELEAAAARGVHTLVKVYDPETSIPGATTLLNPTPEIYLSRMPFDLIIAIVDGSEVLIATLEKGRKSVRQAIWTPSASLSYMFHASLTAEMQLTALLSALVGVRSMEELESIIGPVRGAVAPAAIQEVERVLPFRSRLYTDVPGLERLMKQFSAAP